MMRRRRGVIAARRDWISGPTGHAARVIGGQALSAAITPRVDRIIELLELRPGKHYVDLGCGTSSLAHLVGSRASLERPPVCLDLVPGIGPVDAVAWPENLPLADHSCDAFTCFYLVRRFDDDMVHGLAQELSRVLAPGGHALLLELAPVRWKGLDRLHRALFSAGCPEVDLRGWGRLAALLTECGFDAIDLVNVGPFLVPPVPRIGVLVRIFPAGESGS